jgi:RNA polymerase sigma-70 factor (ECF subfamily)
MTIIKNKYKKLSDEKLMAFINRGHTAAFNELYTRYSSRLLHYFYRMLGGNEHNAQDFLQDIFLKIVERPDLFCSKQPFSSWIFTIAHNMCKNEYRRQEIRRKAKSGDMDEISQNNENDYHSTEHKIDHKLFEKALLVELNKIDGDQRSAFLLRYQENLSIKEIQNILSCPEGTIKSRLFYTTRKLANLLKDFNPYENEVEEK